MAAITSQSVNSGAVWQAYEVKAGMVCLYCKNCVIIPEHFSGEFLTMGHYTNVLLVAKDNKSGIKKINYFSSELIKLQ